MRHIESQIQKNCVAWFRLQYPSIGRLLFAVPNGGARNAREAGIMKGEGVTAGVSDLILLYPSGGFHSLCIEFKTEAKNSKQSPLQKEWQALAEEAGNKYIVCRSFDDFHREIKAYLPLQCW
ncbi:MAG: VRR-NUC domain-containing protein [Clostridia bacterium]|nr:VRR-NUC domain-containing protein [Clostridia bacterium]